MAEYLIFDSDYDESKKSHIDPNRNELMEDPFRSVLNNPHLYCASPYNFADKYRNDPEISKLRNLIDESIESVAQGLNYIRKSNDISISLKRPPMSIYMPNDKKVFSENIDKTDVRIPPMFKDGKPTVVFWLMIDRINQCAEHEKQMARELGQREGLTFGYNLCQKAMEDPSIDLQEAMDNAKYPDYSEKYRGEKIIGGVVSDKSEDFAKQTLQKAWKQQDDMNKMQ